jgi:hypothetical protein
MSRQIILSNQQKPKTGIDYITEGIIGAFGASEKKEEKKKLEAQTKRQRALEAAGILAKAAESGVEITPELEGQLMQDQESGGVGGLTKLIKQSGIKRGERSRAEKERKLTSERRKSESDLRKEISANPATRDLMKIDAAFGKVNKSAKKATAAGDLSMVFNFMKMLDPGSTVREGEFANAAAAAGLPDRMIQYAKKIDDGTILTPEQREDFLNTARESAAAQFESFERVMSPVKETVTERGLQGGRIFPKFESKRFLGEPKKEVAPTNIAQEQSANIPTGLKRMEVPQSQGGNILDGIIPPAQAETNGRDIISPERTKARQSEIQRLRQELGVQ